jgi:hypothetical protein
MANEAQIDLAVDVNVQIKELKLDTEKLTSKIKAAVGSLKDIPISPKLATDFKELDKDAANLSKKVQDAFAKISKQTPVALNLAEKLRKEFLSGANAVDKDGNIIGKQLRRFMLQQLESVHAYANLDKKKTLWGQFVDIEGQNIATAKKMLTDMSTKMSAEASKVTVAQTQMARSLNQASESLKLGIGAATNGISSQVSKTISDVNSLAEAFKFLGLKNKDRQLLLDPTPTAENYGRLVKVLEAARERYFILAAQVHNNKKAEEELGVSSEQVAVHLAKVRDEIDRQLPKYRALAEEQARKVKLDKELANQQARLQKALSTVTDSGTKPLRDQIEAYNELLRIQRAIRANSGTDLGVKSTRDTLAQLKLQLKATEQIATAQSLVDRSADLGTREQAAARSKLNNLLIQYKDLLAGDTSAEVSASKQALARLEERLAKEKQIAAAEERLVQLTAARAKSSLSDTQTLLRLKKEEFDVTLALEKAKGLGRDGSAQVLREVEALKQRLATEEKELSTLTKLKEANKELYFRRSATAPSALNTQRLGSGAPAQAMGAQEFAKLKSSVEAYSKAIQQAQDGVAQMSARGLHYALALTAAWEKDRETLLGVIAVQEQLQKAQAATQRVGTAKGNDAAKLIAMREEVTAHQRIVDILGVQGRAQSAVDQATLAHSRARVSALQGDIAMIRQQVNETNRLGESYTSLSSAFRSFLRYAVEMAAFYQGLSAFQAAAKSVVDLEDALKGVQAVARATDTEMEKVAASVKRVAIDTEFSTNDIAGAAQTLSQAGVGIGEIGEALDATSLAASATATSLAVTADVLTTMHNVFKDMSFTEIADQMTSTINLSKLTGAELSTILSRAVEVSDSFHIIPAQMNAAFAVLRNAGIKASTISTGYRESLLELFAPDAKTLSFLEKRYAELGQTLSQGAIAELFQGFANSADPISAVTAELDKLGFATSASSDFARVYSVRAKNVLDVLVKQRGEYVNLTTQVGAHGAAAKGSATQMEALGKTWDNLGSVITAVAANAFGPALDHLQKLTKGLSDFIERGGEAADTMKKVSGSSGTAVAGLSGLASLMATIRGGGGALRGTTVGLGVAALAQGVQVFASEYMEKIHTGLGEVTAKAAEAAGLFFAVRSVILRRDLLTSLTGIYTQLSTRILAAGAVAQSARILAGVDPAASARAGVAKGSAAAASAQVFIQSTFLGRLVTFFDKVKVAILSNGVVRALTFTPYGRIISASVAAVGASLLFFRKDVNEQLNAINNQIATAENALKKATTIQTDLAAEKAQNQDLKAGLDAVQKSAKEYFDRTIDNAKGRALNISGMLSKLQGVSTDLQGSQLAGAIDELQTEFGVLFNSTYNIDQLIGEMNGANAIMAKAEGGRQAYYQKLIEAFEAYNPADKTKINENALVDAFQKLSEAQKAVILNEVNTLDEAILFQQASETFGERLKKEVFDKIEDAKADLAAREGEAVKVILDKAIQDKSFAGVYAKLLQAVKEGNRDLIDVYIEQLQRVNEESKNKLGDNAEGWLAEVSSFGSLIKEDLGLGLSAIAEGFKNAFNNPLDEFFAELKKLTTNELGNIIQRQADKILNDPVAFFADPAKAIAKSTLYKKPDTKGEVPQEAFDAANLYKEQALANAISKAKSTTTSQAAIAGDQAGRLARSLTPERRKELEILDETIAVQAKSIEEQLKNVDKEWTTFYEETFKTNKSAKDIQDILKRTVAAKKDTPELFIKELASIEERVKIEAAAQVAAKESAQLADDHLQASRALVDSTQRMYEEKKTADPARAAILQERIDAQLAKQGLEQEEVAKAIETNKVDLTKLNIHVASTAVSAEEMEKEYKELKQKSSATTSAMDKLTRAREAAFASGNAQYILDNDVDQNIYNLKVKSLEPLRAASKTALFRMERIPESLRAVEESYEGISQFFETGEGAKFLQDHADAGKRLEVLNEVNKTLADAGLDLAEKQSTLANVLAEQSLKNSTEKALANKAVLDREQALANINDPVKAEIAKDTTEIETAKELVALQDIANKARVAGYEAAIAKAEKLKGVEASTVKLSVTKQQITDLETLRTAHRQTYEQMRDVELKHAQAAEAIETQLFSQKRGQLEFLRGIESQGLSEYQQLQKAKSNAAKDASEARTLLAKGEYVQGKQLLESAIKEQETIVQTTAQAKGEGLSGQKSRLKGLYQENNKLLEGEIALHKQAEAAAKQAADQQLSAIQGLTTAIETLNTTLAGIKVGAQNAAKEVTGLDQAAQGLAENADIKLNFNVESARQGLAAILEGVRQVAKESQTPEELQLSVGRARESIAALREQFLAYARDANTPIAAQETVGKALGQLTDLDTSVAAAGEGQPSKQALAGFGSQLAAIKGYIEEIETSLQSLPQDVAPAVQVDPTQAVQATDEIQAAIDGITGKEVEVIVNKVVKGGNAYSNVPEEPLPEFAQGGLVSAKVSNNEYQMPPETVKAVGTGYLSSLGEISQPGLIKGPGSGTSDSIHRSIPENSFIIPAKVVDKLGVPFLDKIRQGHRPILRAAGGLISDMRGINFDPSIVAQVPPIDLKMPPLPQAKSTAPLQHVTFNVGGATIAAQAPADAVADFQSALRLQALKAGRKVV